MMALSALSSRDWDIIVIGGGITGAGILREATRLGLHALLVDQRDFTSRNATWPLPWYLRKFSRVGYWTEPADMPAD